MSGWLIALCGLAYLYVSCDQLARGNVDMWGVYLGYAFSNIWLYRMAS